MLTKPILNDMENPITTVLIYDYESKFLESTLQDILFQDHFKNIEIIYMDNPGLGKGWDIAVAYAGKYKHIITLHRKNMQDPQKAFHYGRLLAQGKYLISLTGNNAFRAAYFNTVVRRMEADPLLRHDQVMRASEGAASEGAASEGAYSFKVSQYRLSKKFRPLVNILIHNFNYGCFLRQCLDSVIAQTYSNIEVIFSDNNSDDDSWKIIVEYADNYPGLFTIIRNRKNFGPAQNLENCYHHIRGKYFTVLCSDDALEPGFIQACVSAMEENDGIGFAMTHRSILDEAGKTRLEPSFYNQTCIIPGAEQAAVYMMASVNPSISQIVYDVEKVSGQLPVGNVLAYRWFSQRFLDFNLSTKYDVVYIKEPLLKNRIHKGNDTAATSFNLIDIFAQYVLAHQLAEIARSKNGLEKAIGRLPAALEKVGKLCIRYGIQALKSGDEYTAQRYYHLGLAIAPDLLDDPAMCKLGRYRQESETDKAALLDALTTEKNLASRGVSYDPPPGYRPFEVSVTP